MNILTNINALTYTSRRALRYGIISIFVLALLNIYTADEPRWYLYVFVFLFGALIGIVHNLFAGKRLSGLPLPILFIVEFLIINFFTLDFLLLYFYISDGPNVWSDWESVKEVITSEFYRSLIMDVVVTSSVVLFYIKIEELMGDRMFAKYLLGQYAKPKKEIRIFMFIDMRDSTTIAEQLDDFEFFQFVNECFRMMSPAVLKTHAEILKYIGDEVIFTWKPHVGLNKSNCLQLFFRIEKALEKKKSEFKEKYGFEPQFKAGIHIGEVISAQVGDIKKNIDFSGDVINTAARIQSVCNKNSASLLISEELFELLPEEKEKYFNFDYLGPQTLKGKESAVSLYSVTKPEKKEEKSMLKKMLRQ